MKKTKNNFRTVLLESVLLHSQYGISDYPPESGDIPILKMNNLLDGIIVNTNLTKISLSDSETKKYKLDRGDILFNRTNSLDLVGKTAIFDLCGEYVFASYLVRFVVDSKKMNPFFLNYYFNSQKAKNDLKKFASKGVSQVNINPTILRKSFFVPLPPLFHQKKVVRILSTWDVSITCTQKLLENSRQQKKALMQQLLTGGRRLPSFTKNWLPRKLKDLFRRVTTRNSTGCTTVVTISAQQGLIRQEDFFNKTVASSTLDNYFLIKNGDFAYNKSYSKGYPFGAIKRLNKYEYGVVTSLYICFELYDTSQGDKDFFEHFFEYGSLNQALEKIAHEGGRAHGLLNVKPDDFFAIRMTIPPLDEQKAIAKILTTADALIAQYEARLAHLQKQKKALMQQLLTGKIRVTPDVPDEASETPA